MITFSQRRDIEIEQILPIYQANQWSSKLLLALWHLGHCLKDDLRAYPRATGLLG